MSTVTAEALDRQPVIPEGDTIVSISTAVLHPRRLTIFRPSRLLVLVGIVLTAVLLLTAAALAAKSFYHTTPKAVANIPAWATQVNDQGTLNSLTNSLAVLAIYYESGNVTTDAGCLNAIADFHNQHPDVAIYVASPGVGKTKLSGSGVTPPAVYYQTSKGIMSPLSLVDGKTAQQMGAPKYLTALLGNAYTTIPQ